MGIWLAGGLAAVALAGCAHTPTAAEEATSDAQIREALSTTVRYEVGGTASQADITIQTPTGSSQQSGVDVPLKSKAGTDYLQFTFQSGDFVYLSAQNTSGVGTVTCTISDESGRVISHNEASGGYAIATCKGTA